MKVDAPPYSLVKFRKISEKWYTLELDDHVVLKFRFVVKNIIRERGASILIDGRPLYAVSKCPSLGVPDFRTYSVEELEQVAEKERTKFRLLSQGENVYETENGSKVTIKFTSAAIRRTKLFDSLGLPLYHIHDLWTPDVEGADDTRARIASDRLISRSKDPTTFHESQIKVMDWLFPTGWLSDPKNSSHPAAVRRNICEIMMKRGGTIRIPDELDKLPIIARMALDSLVVSFLSGGDVKALAFGSIESLGDEQVRKKIFTRVVDPRMFEDVMVELYTAGWHKSVGHEVIPLEKEGLPDIFVTSKNTSMPIIIECKHVSVGTENRIQKVIKKASGQIENAVLEIS